MADLIADPFDMDGDGVFWDPHIGTDNSPAAEAARAQAEAKRKAQSKAAQKEAQNKNDEKKKKATQAKKAAESAAITDTSSAPNFTLYAGGALAVLLVLFLVRR